MRALVAACLLLAACDHPPLSLRFRLTDGDSQRCMGDTGAVTTSCQDITMLCPAYVSIRVLNPDDPDAPYISVCKPLKGLAQDKLCGIASIDLPQPAMPISEQVLEVQMAVFPEGALSKDQETGELVCPRVRYAANGLPVPVDTPCDSTEDPFTCPKVPAIGGRAYYNPGDDKTVVELGCTDLEKITSMCPGSDHITVSATVNDLDAVVSSVDKTIADRLSVSVGEPKFVGDTYELGPGGDLLRTAASVPAWSGLIDPATLTSTACLEVRDVVGAETTTALTCRTIATPIDDFGIAGFYLKKSTLSAIVGALGLTAFPDQGLVVGIVLDKDLAPLPNVEVAASCAGCTIKYISDDLMGTIAGGTGTKGIFVSQDAPYGATFSIPSVSPTTAQPVLGGIVDNKVTIVIIQDKDTVVGGG